MQCTVSNFVDDLVRVQLFCTIILGYGLLALGSTYGHRTPSATIRRGKYQVFSKQLFRQAWPVCPVCKCVALTSYAGIFISDKWTNYTLAIREVANVRQLTNFALAVKLHIESQPGQSNTTDLPRTPQIAPGNHR